MTTTNENNDIQPQNPEPNPLLSPKNDDIVLINHIKHDNIIIPYGNYTLIRYNGTGGHDTITGATELDI